MARHTSVEVYRQIEEEGLLSKMRFEVYQALFNIGPATAGEIASKLMKQGVPSGGGRAGAGNVSARLVELKELGVAAETGERVCKVTERNVIEWDVTDQLPTGEVKSNGITRPKPEVMKAALIELRQIIRVASAHNGYRPSPNMIALGKWLSDKFEKS